ncbi:MAG TPA: hypothetical protein VGJ13_04795 [Pseudonocardiaceae bacterium]|jgi:hypothetical protein
MSRDERARLRDVVLDALTPDALLAELRELAPFAVDSHAARADAVLCGAVLDGGGRDMFEQLLRRARSGDRIGAELYAAACWIALSTLVGHDSRAAALVSAWAHLDVARDLAETQFIAGGAL